MVTSPLSVVRPQGGYREVVVLALPVILSMLSQTLMSAIDIALLGRFGTLEQAAAGLGAAFLWPFLHALLCIGTGVNIFVAQYTGAQRHQACGAVTWQGLYVSLLAWLVMVAGGLSARWLIELSAPSPELIEPAALYLRIRLLGGLPILCNVTLASFFRGRGDTRTPFVIVVIIELVNVVLDIGLIFGYAGLPRLGLAGSAIASAIASAIGTVIYVVMFLRRGQREGLLARPIIAFDYRTCWRLIRVSWPVGLHGALEMGAWTLFTAFVARLGAVETAAHAVATQIMALSYMSGYGVSIAATTVVGQYLGARNPEAARQSMVSCLVLVTLLMGSLGGGFFLWRHLLVQLFTTDPAVLDVGAHLLIFVALFQIFDGFGLIAMGILRGAGDTHWPMIIALVTNWLVFLPVAGVAMFVWHGGIFGGWGAALFYVAVLAVALMLRLLRSDWQSRVLV